MNGDGALFQKDSLEHIFSWRSNQSHSGLGLVERLQYVRMLRVLIWWVPIWEYANMVLASAPGSLYATFKFPASRQCINTDTWLQREDQGQMRFFVFP